MAQAMAGRLIFRHRCNRYERWGDAVASGYPTVGRSGSLTGPTRQANPPGPVRREGMVSEEAKGLHLT